MEIGLETSNMKDMDEEMKAYLDLDLYQLKLEKKLFYDFWLPDYFTVSLLHQLL